MLIVILSFFVYIIFLQAETQEAKKAKSIVNGKNLKGWAVPENNIYWTVEYGNL